VCAGNRPDTCQGTLYSWAPGSETFATPTDVHIHLGQGARHKTVVMEIHYNNVDGVKNETDSSALNVWYSTKPRKHGCDYYLD
jgi:adenosine deaminase